MTTHLIRTTGAMIPGAYQFQDPITGKSYTDHHTLFDQRVRQIINDRKANARLFTNNKFIDLEYVSRELSEQNCQRLKNNKLFCDDGLPKVNSAPTASFAPQPVPAGKVCRYCGGQLTEVLCQTCSGRRVLNLHCPKCKKDFPNR